MVSPTSDENTQNSQTEDMNNEDQYTEDSSTSDTEDSSGSDKSEKEPSTFDVVMNTLNSDGEEDDETEVDSDEDGSKDEDDEKSSDKDDEASDEPTEEELKSWKPKTKERFEKLQTMYREEKEAREKAEVDAGHYKQFTEFLDTNRISQDEANQLFNIGAMMKNDPVEALKLITPYYQDLLQVTGNILPPDLQKQVAEGYITRENALKMSQMQAQNATKQAIEQDQTQYQKQQQNRQQQDQMKAIQGGISSWERNWSTSDPDYSKKKDRVLDRVELMLTRAAKSGALPQTVEQAVELANKAKSDVEAELAQFKPKKSVTTVDGGSSSTALPEPKNTEDVIRRTLNM
jgi:hypothetical protein